MKRSEEIQRHINLQEQDFDYYFEQAIETRDAIKKLNIELSEIKRGLKSDEDITL